MPVAVETDGVHPDVIGLKHAYLNGITTWRCSHCGKWNQTRLIFTDRIRCKYARCRRRFQLRIQYHDVDAGGYALREQTLERALALS